MAKITYVEHDGKEHVADGENGMTVMEVAIKNSVPGIDADCGGACACGTCHVIVDSKWMNAAGSINKEELQMLEMTPEKTPTSRLSCQIKASDAMDGMIVHLPEFQM